MPLYVYECELCAKTQDELRSIADRNAPLACKCGGSMKKIIGGHAVISDVEPYFDENLEAYVKSRQHRRALMRERGVDEKIGKGWI